MLPVRGAAAVEAYRRDPLEIGVRSKQGQTPQTAQSEPKRTEVRSRPTVVAVATGAAILILGGVVLGTVLARSKSSASGTIGKQPLRGPVAGTHPFEISIKGLRMGMSVAEARRAMSALGVSDDHFRAVDSAPIGYLTTQRHPPFSLQDAIVTFLDKDQRVNRIVIGPRAVDVLFGAANLNAREFARAFARDVLPPSSEFVPQTTSALGFDHAVLRYESASDSIEIEESLTDAATKQPASTVDTAKQIDWSHNDK